MILRKFIGQIKSSEFSKNVLVVIVGTGITQLIPILISPILTRIYSPEDFGIYSVYISITSIISVIATARYENAIVLPENEEDVFFLVILTACLTFITSLISLVIVISLSSIIMSFFKLEGSSLWLYFIPLTVLISGLFAGLNNYFIKNKLFKTLTINKVTQSALSAVMQLIMGLFKKGAWGMLAGSVAGQGAGVLNLSTTFFLKEKKRFGKITFEKIKQIAVRYKSFPKFSLTADLINVAANQIPAFFFTAYFNTATAGFYSLTQRMLAMPISLIGRSVLDVFRERAASDYIKFGNCETIFIKTAKSLFLLAIIPTLIIFFFSPYLFSIIFGEEWRTSGDYARILSFLFFVRFIVNPLSYVIYIAEKQKYDMIWQIVLLIISIISLATGVYFNNASVSIISFSISYSIMYLIYFILSYKCAKGTLR